MARTLRAVGIANLALVPVAWAAVVLSLGACEYACGEPDSNYAGGLVLLLLLSVAIVALAVFAVVSPFPGGRPETAWQRRVSLVVVFMFVASAGLLLATTVGALLEPIN